METLNEQKLMNEETVYCYRCLKIIPISESKLIYMPSPVSHKVYLCEDCYKLLDLK